MFNKQLLAILIPLTLSGCGGSDDGGSSQPKPKPKYTFDFAQFYTEASAGNCSVFGKRMAGGEELSVLANTDVSLSLDRDKLLIQYADGVVKEEVPLDGSRQQINQTDVPKGGYVTFYIELLDKYFATSIQRKYLKSNGINWLGYEKVDAPNNPRCVTGKNAPDANPYTGIDIKTADPSDIKGVVTSDKRKLTENGSKDIDIQSRFSHALAVAYQYGNGENDSNLTPDEDGYVSDADLDTPREITEYKFFDLANNTEVELDPLSEMGNWTAPANTYDLTSAALYVDYQQTPYIWQNLPHSASEIIDYRYDADNDNLSYYLTAEGTVKASSSPSDEWQLSAARQVSALDLAEDLNNDTLDSDNAISVPEKRTSVEINNDVLSAYGNGAGGQAGIQRIAYQVADGSTTVTHVIYAEANAQQTVPLFDNNTIDSLVNGAGTLSNYDISVMYTENEQALAALMAEHTNPSITDNSDLSVDPLPVLLTTYEREQLARKKKIIDHYQISTSNP
ncbi:MULTISPECIES: hypothetical protein [unclassified Salinivibrio]|uniref:hypothetical protein n=1 Tax=unclassified Salinivibrio TaxID=2636825 RepID=UPI00128E235E|nr:MULTISPECIES: hypothetical protein [unclassified Salinivibrio]MPS32407.1 hypothetical protein [Salinivibrio sp. VYel7]MPX93800.1 hypothetical protein [Salinivibrio sp. VYel9]MPX96037.1 hypothetical protein [Salinivibrio sp. VYel6]MPY00265.1 hypothetical protein [Salinivibrio sp. VYel4]MPY03278.1 hypothetical protein [Salinivibrio sp. VYel5]